jgi:hypothetical protein
MMYLGVNHPGFEFLAYAGAALEFGVVGVVAVRFYRYGHERESSVTSLDISHERLILSNLGRDNPLLDPVVLAQLVRVTMQIRQDLPTPMGTIIGSVSDDDSIQLNLPGTSQRPSIAQSTEGHSDA